MKEFLQIGPISVVVGVIILFSCTPVDIMVISDEFFAEFDWGLPPGEIGIVEILTERGLKYEVYKVELGSRIPDLTKELSEDTKKGSDASLWILSPVLSFQGADLAVAFPDVKVLTLGRENYAAMYDDIENLSSIYSDRTNVFRGAGNAIGKYLIKYLRDDDRSEETENEIIAEAYFYTGSRSARLEMAAFVEGLKETTISDLVEITEIDNISGKQNVKNRIDGSIKRKIPFLLFFLDELNAFCLDTVQDETVSVVSDSIIASGGYFDRILFSIEESRRSALEDALSKYFDGTIQEERVEEKEMRSFIVESLIAIPKNSETEEVMRISEEVGVPFSVVDDTRPQSWPIIHRIEEFLGIR